MKTWTLAEVAKHWDSTIEYDEINDKTASYERRFIDSAPLFTIPPGARVLDLDARTGRGSQYFFDKYPNNSNTYTCLVVSDLFKSIAQERLQKANVPATVKKFSTLPLPEKGNTYGVTLSYETLEHMPNPEEFIRELVRVTKPGGTIVLTTPTVAWEPIHQLAPLLHLHHSEGPHRMVRRKTIIRTFQNAGCKKLKEKTTVFVPAGPTWLLHLGEELENLVGESIRRHIALRRIFVWEKL